MRTRIKICGLTRQGDVADAIRAGADAIGLVFYPPSPRAVTIEQARELCCGLPPFVTVVGLFVNETRQRVQQIVDALPVTLLQFHGEEDAAFCTSFGRPYMKAARVKGAFDLVDYAACHPHARAILLDAWVDGYGGGGLPFDWSMVPSERPVPLVLAGGLNPHNVGDAIRAVRPWAVDVSSGVETAKGIKDRGLMEAFVAGVRDADA